MITLKDVAEHAGVSTQLVSVVLNGKAKKYRISQATQERVEEAARQMGYDPDNNRSARQMAARKHGKRLPNNLIAVCALPSPRSFHEQPFEGPILDGVESAANRYGLDVLLFRLQPEKMPRLITKGEVDGVIMVSGRLHYLDAFRQLDIPVVKTGSMPPDCDTVTAQDREGIYEATSHLIGLGHTQIGFIGHAVDATYEESILVDNAKERLAGYLEAMAKANLPTPYIETPPCGGVLADGAAGIKKLWQESQGALTAVVCYNDTMAMGAIQAAQEMGLRVPGDVSVTGFDNISQHYDATTVVSSVDYDRRRIGVRAVEILMEAQSAPEKKKEFVLEKIPTQFVEGNTTAPPRKTNSKER